MGSLRALARPHAVRLLLPLAVAVALLLVPPATVVAAGNASRAAAFIEKAQNRDGGFGRKPGRRSDRTATLWASVALLAAGKNPKDEWLKGGRSADEYLIANRGRYRSIGDLGLLALIQSSGRLSVSRYDDPAAKLRRRLSQEAARTDPGGTALAIFGLLAEGGADSKRTARAAGDALLRTITSDGAWGPTGNADSASTALVLQALAATGQLRKDDPAARSGVAYLHAAQGNDGGVLANGRLDKGVYSASVPATAFAIQALDALGLGTLRTPTGKTLRQGLADYQQRVSGGLSSTSAYDERTAPSVVDTSQAFAAFNGRSFVLAKVASTTGGPGAARRKQREAKQRARAKDRGADRVSTGSAKDGVSDTNGSATRDSGAFDGARAGSAKGDANSDRKAERDGARGAGAKGKRRQQPADGGGAGGQDVSGTVVGGAPSPQLQTKAGAADDGLTRKQQATLTLGIALALLLIGGLVLETRRPRGPEAPGLITLALIAVGRGWRPIRRTLARVSGVGAVAHAARGGGRLAAARRWPLVLVLVAGIGLVAVPLTTSMLDRASQGATMIERFRPHMSAERIARYQRDIALVNAFASEAQQRAPALIVPKADPATARAEFLQAAPQVALFVQQWPAVDRTFSRLLGTIAANRENFDAVAALPSFRLFPWFFLVPGVLAIVLALAGLALGGRAWPPLRRATIALGVGLLLAPLAFQMFARAPAGERMIDAFATIETRQQVQTVQSHFGTVAVGQGAVRNDLVEPLLARGLREREIARELPASIALRDRWTSILNDITPLIGVMSDNVANYRAVRALPAFGLFPWLFVVPGLLVLAAAVLARTDRRPGRPFGGSPADPNAEPDPRPDRELVAA